MNLIIFPLSNFTIKSERHLIEIRVSSKLDTHIHWHTCVDTHTHTQAALSNVSFFLNTCNSTSLLMYGELPDLMRQCSPPSVKVKLPKPYFPSFPCIWDKDTRSSHYQSYEPTQELQRPPRAPSGKRHATENVEFLQSRAGVAMPCSVTMAPRVQATASNTVQYQKCPPDQLWRLTQALSLAS